MTDNYIERDYLQYRILEECESPDLTKEADDMLSTIYGLVINAPSCDVEYIVHAHKVRAHSQGGGTHWVVCSHCEKPIDWQDAYCKHCGAKMDEVSK